jgi:hypothetical protein
MGINYHAYQCKNFMLADYEEIQKQWRADFTNYQPERVVEILNLQRDEQYVYVPYFQDLFRLRLEDGVLEKKVQESAQETASSSAQTEFKSSYIQPRDFVQEEEVLSVDGWSERVYFNEAMSVYHILKDVKDHPLKTGKWIPNGNLDPRSTRNTATEDLLTVQFTKQCLGKMKALEEACKKCGGVAISTKGDIGYQFVALPQVEVQLHYWEEDEEFPAQVQIMVDSNVTDYIHLETTGCLASDLFERLLKKIPVIQ